MLKFLVQAQTTHRPYMVGIKGPDGLEEKLQEITKPQDESRLLRYTDITNKVKFPYGQLMRNLINYLGANNLTYYYPKTHTLLHIHIDESLVTQPLTIGRTQYWLERYSLDAPDLIVNII